MCLCRLRTTTLLDARGVSHHSTRRLINLSCMSSALMEWQTRHKRLLTLAIHDSASELAGAGPSPAGISLSSSLSSGSKACWREPAPCSTESRHVKKYSLSELKRSLSAATARMISASFLGLREEPFQHEDKTLCTSTVIRCVKEIKKHHSSSTFNLLKSLKPNRFM